jgi:threonine synthase
MAKKVSERTGWPNVSTAATFNPYALQGQKTGAYEIVEQLGWNVPDWVVVPVGSGNCLAGQWAGFKDLLNLGLIGKTPRLAAVQSTGCAPFTDAVRRGLQAAEVKPWENPSTIAGGVNDDYPFDVEFALPAIRESGGAAVSVTDEEIMETVRTLGREGAFVEPTGAVATAGIKHLADEKIVDNNETIVTLLTGSGLKDPHYLAKLLPKPPVIDPDIEAAIPMLKSSQAH